MDPVGAHDVLSADQISTIATRELSSISEHGNKITEVMGRLGRQISRDSFLTDEEFNASVEKHGPQVDAVEDKALAVARRAAAFAHQALAQLQNTDRTNLTDEELTKANLRAAFVKEDAERASIGQLRDMIRRAIQSGDRAEQFLMSRAGRDRLDSPKERDTRDGDAQKAVSEVRSMVLQINESFRDKSMDRYRDKAAEVADAARRLKDKSIARNRPPRVLTDPRTGEQRVPWPRDTAL